MTGCLSFIRYMKEMPTLEQTSSCVLMIEIRFSLEPRCKSYLSLVILDQATNEQIDLFVNVHARINGRDVTSKTNIIRSRRIGYTGKRNY